METFYFEKKVTVSAFLGWICKTENVFIKKKKKKLDSSFQYKNLD